MHVANSHNAISRWEKRVYISLLCNCSGIALGNEEKHAHLTHLYDSNAPNGEKVLKVYFHIQDKMYLLWVAKKTLPLIFNLKFPSLHKV